MNRAARPRLSAPLRRGLRRHIGLWRMHELKNQVLHGPGSIPLWRFENREVARLRAQLGSLRHAECATVIATYRRPEMVVDAVGSALAQTLADQVVIVVDDGGGLPRLPADPRLHAVSLARNTAAVGVVRNVGIRLTSSSYIAFLDDDNRWRTDHLETALAAFGDNDGDVNLVYTGVERWNGTGTRRDVISQPFDKAHLLDGPGFIDASAIVVRRGAPLFSRLRRPMRTIPREDWVLAHRVASTGRVIHVPDVTVDYLAHSGSYYTPWEQT